MFIASVSRKLVATSVLLCATLCHAQPQSGNGFFEGNQVTPTATPIPWNDETDSEAQPPALALGGETGHSSLSPSDLAIKDAKNTTETSSTGNLDEVLVRMPNKTLEDVLVAMPYYVDKGGALRLPNCKYKSPVQEKKTFEGSFTATNSMTKLALQNAGAIELTINEKYISISGNGASAMRQIPIAPWDGASNYYADMTPGESYHIKIVYYGYPYFDGISLVAYGGEPSIKITLPEAAYSIDAIETQAQVSLNGEGGSKSVKIGLPLGAKLLQPTTNPFSMAVGTTKSITVQLPSTPGDKSFTAQIVETAQQSSQDIGMAQQSLERSFAPQGVGTTQQASATVEAVRIDDVVVAYRSSNKDAFPLSTDAVRLRAIIYATGAKGQAVYSDRAETNDGKWFTTGSDGPDSDWLTPTLSKTAHPQIKLWPTAWPKPTFDWRKRYHDCSDKNGAGNRTYFYKDETPSWRTAWGTAGTLPRGIIRYRVKVSLNVGKPGAQSKTSKDDDKATRIAVRDAGLPLDPQGRSSLRWMSCFLSQPYEYGGWGFGGKTSKTPTGSSPANEGFSLDCSALISQGARKTGYNWTTGGGPGGWRYATSNLTGVTAAVSETAYAAGDIMNKPGNHTVACTKITRAPSGAILEVIQSVGHDIDGSRINKVVVTRGRTFQQYKDARFVKRRLQVQR